MKILSISLFFMLISQLAHAQFGKGDNKYTLGKLTQEQVSKAGKQPVAAGVKDAKDTTFTTYNNVSVYMRMYLVKSKSKDAGSSTGVYLNNQRFVFYCDIEKAFRQSTSNFLEIYEFSYLGKKYLALTSLRDDCVGNACAYKCYNLFDITNPKQISQVSFASIHGGVDSFGDFNFDGIMDFVRVMPKEADNTKGAKADGSTYTLTAYTIGLGNVNQLKNKTGQGHYILAKGDADAKEFEVIQQDWMIPLKSAEGKVIETEVAKEPIIPFDPMESILYSMTGEKVEKNKYGLIIDKFADVEGALKFCEELRSRKFADIFLLPDQYNKRLYYYVLVGNYYDKTEGTPDEQRLKKIGIKTTYRDFSQRYSVSDK
jgi:hypothetical protein